MAERLNPDTEPDCSVVPPALMAHAADTFGTAAKAHLWLATPNRALDHQLPLTLARTCKGAQRVEEVLTRIDYGIFS
jgi:putative toxin-antitoxin system antitoxin component (TIGR02293 family)